METTYLFAPLVKAEKQADGTLMVTGPMSSPSLDRDKQVCDPGWLEGAVPEWFAESGNIREQHQLTAAGKAMDCWKAEDGKHWLKAKVVDPVSVLKVENDVLTGFSIGIKGARIVKDAGAPGGRIVGGKIIEVSLVDRPANPECVLTIAKTDAAGHAELVEQELLTKGEEQEPTDDASMELASEHEVAVHDAAQDVRDRAAEVLTALSNLGLDLEHRKADSATDCATAQEAIACIAQLIQSEAQGLAAGQMNEAGDIGCLLDAVAALRYFIARESSEDSTDESVTSVALADAAKAEEPTEPTEEPAAPAADTTKTEQPGTPELLTKADIAELLSEGIAAVKAEMQDALTKAEEAHEAESKALRAELAKVQAQPVAGGPVRVRAAADKAKADHVDRTGLLAEAAEYDAKADKATDRDVADGYRELARQKREQAR